MVWTRFMDIHSGGGGKIKDWQYIYIEAPMKKAKHIFEELFHRDPDNETCNCCGNDFSIDEYWTLAVATAYDRNCKFIRVKGEDGGGHGSCKEG